jgi:DNA-binding protein YbaB
MLAVMEMVAATRDEVVTIGRDLAELEIQAMSPDGLVTVVVDGCGRITGLELSPRIYRRTDSRALAAQIVDVVRQASDEASRRAFALTDAALGGELR